MVGRVLVLALLVLGASAQCSGNTDCYDCWADGECYWYPTSTTKCQLGQGPDAEGHTGGSCNPSCTGAQCSECTDSAHCTRASCSWNPSGTPQCTDFPMPPTPAPPTPAPTPASCCSAYSDDCASCFSAWDDDCECYWFPNSAIKCQADSSGGRDPCGSDDDYYNPPTPSPGFDMTLVPSTGFDVTLGVGLGLPAAAALAFVATRSSREERSTTRTLWITAGNAAMLALVLRITCTLCAALAFVAPMLKINPSSAFAAGSSKVSIYLTKACVAITNTVEECVAITSSDLHDGWFQAALAFACITLALAVSLTGLQLYHVKQNSEIPHHGLRYASILVGACSSTTAGILFIRTQALNVSDGNTLILGAGLAFTVVCSIAAAASAQADAMAAARNAMAAARRHVELAEVAVTNCKRCNAPLNPTGAPRYCADCLQSL